MDMSCRSKCESLALAASIRERRVSVCEAWSDPGAFIEYCCSEAAGRPLRQGRVHRELQEFLSQHDRALVELPRDHGKSLQVSARVLWELGRNSALRVKIVCATEAIAAE